MGNYLCGHLTTLNIGIQKRICFEMKMTVSKIFYYACQPIEVDRLFKAEPSNFAMQRASGIFSYCI